MEENQILDAVVRNCVINACSSTRTWSKIFRRYISPDGKLFFRFPMDADTRSRWINAVAKSVSEDVLHKLYKEMDVDCFICEDHFDLSKCMLNYNEYKSSGSNVEKIFFSVRCGIPTKKLKKCSLITRVSDYSNCLMEHDYGLLRYRHKLPYKYRKKKDESLKSENKRKPFSPSDNSLRQEHFSNEVAVKTEPEYTTDIEDFECGEYYFSSNSFKKISDIPYSDTSETQSMDLEIMPCDFCSLQFCYKSDLLKHVQAEHLDIGPEEFRCNHCPLSFANEKDCAEHVQVYHKTGAASISSFQTVVNETITLEKIKLGEDNVTTLHSFSNNFQAMSTEESYRNFKAVSQSINSVEKTWNSDKNYISSEFTNKEIVTQSVEKYESINSAQTSDRNHKSFSQSPNAEINKLQFFCIPSEHRNKEINWKNIVKYEHFPSAQETDINNKICSQSINAEENGLKLFSIPSQNTNEEISEYAVNKCAFEKKIRRRKRAVINKQTVKCCFIPTCNNSTENCPDKIFFRLRRKCKLWYQVSNLEYPKEHPTVSYCCQDHFNLSKDTIFKGNLTVLKRNVLPHKNTSVLESKRSLASTKGAISLLKNAQQKTVDDTIASFYPESLLRTKELTGQVKNNDNENTEIKKTESKHNDGENTEIDKVSINKKSKNEDGKYKKKYKRKSKNRETKQKKTRVNQAENQPPLKELKVKLEVLDPKLYTLKNPFGAKDKISLSTSSKEKDEIKSKPIQHEPDTDKHHTRITFDLQMFEKHEKHFIKLLDGMARMRKKEEEKRTNGSTKDSMKETNDIKIERRHSDITKNEYNDFKAENTKTCRKSFDLEEFEKHEENYENILNHKEEDDVFNDNALLKPFKVIKEEVIDEQTVCLKCPNLIPYGQILCQQCKEQQLLNAILIDSQEICPNSIKEDHDNNYDLETKGEFEKIKFAVDLNTNLKRSKMSSGKESNEQNDKESKELASSKRKFIKHKEQPLINAIFIDSQEISPNCIKKYPDNNNDSETKDEFQKIKFAVDFNTDRKHSNSSDEDTNERNDRESKELASSKRKFIKLKEQPLLNAIFIDSQEISPNCIKKYPDNKNDSETKDEFEKIKFAVDFNTDGKHSNSSDEDTNERNDKESKELANSKRKAKLETLKGDTKHKCELCQKEFKHFKHWKDHVKAKHSDTKFTCTICQNTFACQRYLTRHVKKHHSIDATAYAKDNKVDQCFICSVCGLSFKSNDSLVHHVKNCHSESAQCDLCHSTLKSLSYLKSHLRRIHRVEKRRRCKSCPRVFRNQRQLFVHVRNNHPETMKKCACCSRLFNTTKYFERHMKHCSRIPSPLAHLDFEIKIEPADSEEDWCIK